MHKVDIASLVRDALLENDVDESLLNNFDSHSIIVLDFDKTPKINIGHMDDDVWMWSLLGRVNHHTLKEISEKLLSELMVGCAFTRSGQLQCDINEGVFELKALLHPSVLQDSHLFSEALKSFLDSVLKYNDIIN
ncbi:MAG: type secretion system chaperone SpaK [Bacteroidota bacterium]|jgi:hypothetical protein